MFLIIHELFFSTIQNLSDKEKISFISCSKNLYDFRFLLKFNLSYPLYIIYDCWCIPNVKNIIIDKPVESPLYEAKFVELMENFSLTITKSNYMKWTCGSSSNIDKKSILSRTSNGIKITLFYNIKHVEIAVCHQYHYLAMRMMIKNDNSIVNINEKFIDSVELNYVEVAKLLISIGANICTQNNAAIIWSSSIGDLHMVQLLIDLGANVNAQGDLPIVFAAGRGHYSVVKLLIENGANIGGPHHMAIEIAAKNGHYSIVKLLIDNGANVKKNHALQSASLKGHISIVKLLIDSGANIHRMAIDDVLQCGQIEVVHLLIEKGADITANKNQALITALEIGDLFLAKLLINLGANIFAQKNQPIITASENGHLSMVKLLMDMGANIHAQDDRAIILAAKNGYLDIVKLLKRDKSYDQAISLAKLFGHKKIVEFLEKN